MNILSGIQPSGNLHIGNYFGAIHQWIKLSKQPDVNATFIIVDLHAITVYQKPEELTQRTYEVAAIYFASGLDYNKHTVFIQSDNPDHTYLAWIFDTITPIGWLERMTQFKDKRQKLQNYGKVVSTGLFNYPVLMAADILLYDTDIVPVGEDQIQHVELARDIAKRFNKLYGNTFKIPEYRVEKAVARIKDLQNPTKKMSKSDDNPLGCIYIMDDKDTIAKKIKRAVTDSENKIYYDPKNKPGISNLLGILSATTGKTIEDLVNEYQNKNYATLKQDLIDALISVLDPIQQKVQMYLNDKAQLHRIFQIGAEKAMQVSTPKLHEALGKMGFYRWRK